MRQITIDKLKKKWLELVNHRYIGCRLSSFLEYSKLNPSKAGYFKVSAASCVDVAPVTYINEAKRDSEKAFLPEIYIARISKSRIIGNSNVVISEDNTILYDALYDNKDNNRQGFI